MRICEIGALRPGLDGLKQIQQAAREAEMDTQAFCDMNFKTFEVSTLSLSPPFELWLKYIGIVCRV